MRRAVLAFLPAALYAGVIFALSHQPNPLPFLPEGLRIHDKLLHVVEFAALGALLVPALRLAGLPPRRALVAAAAVAALSGATDELHQAFVPGRDADPLDAVADAVGAVLGSAAATAAAVALRRPGGAG